MDIRVQPCEMGISPALTAQRATGRNRQCADRRRRSFRQVPSEWTAGAFARGEREKLRMLRSRRFEVPRNRKAERLRHRALPGGQRGERQAPGDRGDVHGHRDMPGVGTAQVARVKHGGKFWSKRPVRQNPLDSCDRAFREPQILAGEAARSSASSRLDEISRANASSSCAHVAAPGSSNAIAVKTEVST